MQSINNFLFSNPKLSWFWLIVRVYVGYEWIMAGYEKIINPAWVGSSAGGAITGFVNGALAKTAGAHPDVSEWYAWFLTHAVLPNANLWSHAVAYGELAVGLGLWSAHILGRFLWFLYELKLPSGRNRKHESSFARSRSSHNAGTSRSWTYWI